MRDAELESRILRFEQAWRRGGPCEIADSLDHPHALLGAARRRLLIELICVDLEFRWRNHARDNHPPERALIESYSESHPELGAIDDLPLALIGEEYLARHRWGDRPSHSEYTLRFAAREAEIRAELSRIDRELADDSADDRPLLDTVAPSKIDHDLDIPLFSHHDVHLRRMIGSGRTGKVYRAWLRGADREVAVKFLRKRSCATDGSWSDSSARRPRLRSFGARTSSGSTVWAERLPGAYFIIMELVSGPNLDDLAAKRPISVSEAVSWALETCDALDHAHATGVIHCDLKPANLLLGEDGRIRVTDFGLARQLTTSASWTADIEGTAPFMAPEQASPSWGRVDTRTDVYGVGAVLYTLLTGRPPWVGRRLPDILSRVISVAPVLLPDQLRPDVPERINDVCRKCLSKAPDERYQSMRELRSALMECSGTAVFPGIASN